MTNRKMAIVAFLLLLLALVVSLWIKAEGIEMMGWIAFFVVLLYWIVERGRTNFRNEAFKRVCEQRDNLAKRLQLIESKPAAQPEQRSTYFPDLAEGARFLHDVMDEIFIGQYKDADVYAAIWEPVREGEQGLPAGQVGSLLRFRAADAKRNGAHEMLSQGIIHEAMTNPEDDYEKAAAELAQKAGLVRKITNSSDEERYILFKPYSKEEHDVQHG